MSVIMIVARNPELKDMLSALFSTVQNEVLFASSREELVIAIHERRPDLILLDSELPAAEISKALRRNPDTFDVTQIVLGSDSSEDAVCSALKSGADDYILLPLRGGELPAKVNQLILRRISDVWDKIPDNVLFAGSYRILKKLGSGGFATVYLARDIRNDKRVALKVLDKDGGKQSMLRFLREAYTLSCLDHEQIVKVLEIGSYGGCCFLCTEYVSGDSLGNLIRNSPVSEAFALRVAEEMLSAFAEMERHQIIHRDVKPDNILIAPDGKCVLVDFGLAKDQGQKTLSLKEEMEGTLGFFSPEYIANDENINIKSDIYALGVTLYNAVSGELPFPVRGAELLDIRQLEHPAKLVDTVPLVSEAFSRLIDRMLVRNPAQRAGIEELKQMIEDCKNKVASASVNTAKPSLEEASYTYHKEPAPGKLRILPSKACETQEDLSLAYTPGVAFPCLAIQKNPDRVWDYTMRGNSVAVVSDGTAVLGLGNIGAEAGLPVMEGKAVLFKKFADIDAVPLCIGRVSNAEGKSDAKKIIDTVQTFEPTFGGINLEDIGAPACFEVEPALKKIMNIPVFHDDQHGTAIISLSGILNALKVVGKKIENCRFVMNGAGAAGIACAEYYVSAGANRKNFLLCDSKGVIHSGRNDLNEQKKKFANETSCRTLAEAMKGADVFVGVSVAGAVTEEMVASMAPGAVVFAMANPVPEIFPDKALAAGAAVVGTGRSDFYNQVNNVLGFPGIFRGALDVRAKDINESMKLAASRALAEIVCEKMPSDVYQALSKAYPKDAAAGTFDGDCPLKSTFVIPKPFDFRVVPRVARRVAQAAMESGVAQLQIEDFDAYERSVAERIRRASETF